MSSMKSPNRPQCKKMHGGLYVHTLQLISHHNTARPQGISICLNLNFLTHHFKSTSISLPLSEHHKFCFVCILLQRVCFAEVALCLCCGHAYAGSSDDISMCTVHEFPTFRPESVCPCLELSRRLRRVNYCDEESG